MNFVAGTDALIIDLRNNGGGDPEMVALICSYLFGPEPVHLNDLYWREGNRTEQFWTRKEVAGKRYLNKEVYVLTSKYTFSGAEEFTYNLKNLKRATLSAKRPAAAHTRAMVSASVNISICSCRRAGQLVRSPRPTGKARE